jgi:hypothetical protein
MGFQPRAVLAILLVGGGLLSMTACAGTGSGEPLTVQQLVDRSANTPVDVQGLLHVSSGVTRLCAATLESYPVQCGKPSVELVGLDIGAISGTTTAEGVTWKEGVILNVERTDNSRYTVLSVVPDDQP